MPAHIVLIAPENVDAAQLEAALAAAEVSALILPRRDLAENTYKTLVKAIAPKAQSRNCAVLIEGEPGLVRVVGADGVHVAGNQSLVREAVDRLKPDMIVGTAAGSRDEAMAKGEMGVDYVLFEDRDLAIWWGETMQVPAVLSVPDAAPETLDPLGCEFVALSDSLWNSKQGAADALKAYAHRLESV